MSNQIFNFLDVCDFKGGTQPPKSSFSSTHKDGYVRLLQIQDFSTDDYQIFVKESGKLSYCSEKDILIGRYGASVGKIFRGKAGAHNVALIRVLLEESKVDRDYFFYFLQAEKFQSHLKAISARAAQAGFSKTGFSEFTFLAPSLEQQRQIADRLKAQLAEVETARQAAQVQLSEVSALKKRAMESLFSSVQNWSPIGRAAKLQSGYAFKSDSFKSEGVRLLRNANILPGKVYWDKAVFLNESDAEKFSNYVLHEYDVLISLDRPIISSGIKVARVSNDDLPALLVQRVGRFIVDPEKLDKNYLYAFLQTDLFISKITGHDQSLGVPHISPAQVEAIDIPLPEVTAQIELAKRLTQIVEVWQEAVSALHTQLTDLKQLPKAILAQAFNSQGE